MSKAKEILRALDEEPNLVGSHKSFELMRSFFEGDGWANYLMASLELAWQEHAQSQDIIPDLGITRDSHSRDAIDSLINNVDRGTFPPPETLILLTRALQRYLDADGDLSLDEAFFGKTHKKNASYAMAFGKKSRKMRAVSFHIALSHIGPKKRTQLEAVESMLTNFFQDFETDPESLLRTWRRWRKASDQWSD